MTEQTEESTTCQEETIIKTVQVKQNLTSRSITASSYTYNSYAKSMITKPSIPTVKLTAGSRQIKVSWTKISGSNGYEVYMATGRNGNYIKIISANSLQFHYTKTGLTKGKNYYFIVRAFKKTGVGVKVYSGYSSVSSVKIK